MTDVGPGQCRTCGAKILWLAHERTGNMAPIDEEPVTSGGNVMIFPARGTYAIYKGADHLNHWATCKNPPDKKK